ncbi:unnamed protein product [Discula destructiva]
MLSKTLICCFSAAVAALSVDSRHGEEARAIEARALTTLYTTSTIYSKTTSKSTSCLLTILKTCRLATTRTVTTTAAVRTTVVPYTTRTVTSTTSSVRATSSTVTTPRTSSAITSTSSAAASSASPVTQSGTSAITLTASPTLTTSTSSTNPSTTTQAQPTCGFVGFGNGTASIAYYSDSVSGTYAGCNALCTSNTACLSFAFSTLATKPECILYNYKVQGNAIASASSPYTFFDLGGVCPPATATTSTAPAIPSFTAGVQYCPSSQVTYNVTAPVTGYTGCNATYAESTCASGVDGSALCNLCGSCYNATSCTSTASCQTTYGAGYACVANSACVTGGAPVCLYMLTGGDSYGCRGARSGL